MSLLTIKISGNIINKLVLQNGDRNEGRDERKESLSSLSPYNIRIIHMLIVIKSTNLPGQLGPTAENKIKVN